MFQTKQRKPFSRKAPMSRGKGFAAPLSRFAGRTVNGADTPAPARQGLNRRRRAINKRGPKTKAWEAARRALKLRFEAAGITTCEFQGRYVHECTRDNYLGFAHDAKRRKLTTEEDLMRVVLICNTAHDIIEVWPAENMKQIVNDTIATREVQP